VDFLFALWLKNTQRSGGKDIVGWLFRGNETDVWGDLRDEPLNFPEVCAAVLGIAGKS